MQAHLQRSERAGARDGCGASSAQLPRPPPASELAADLTSRCRHVSLPTAPLSLESVQRLDWAPGPGAVLAVVAAAGRARRPLHARLRTRRGTCAGPLGGLGDPDGPRRVKSPKPKRSTDATARPSPIPNDPSPTPKEVTYAACPCGPVARGGLLCRRGTRRTRRAGRSRNAGACESPAGEYAAGECPADGYRGRGVRPREGRRPRGCRRKKREPRSNRPPRRRAIRRAPWR